MSLLSEFERVFVILKNPLRPGLNLYPVHLGAEFCFLILDGDLRASVDQCLGRSTAVLRYHHWEERTPLPVMTGDTVNVTCLRDTVFESIQNSPTR